MVAMMVMLVNIHEGVFRDADEDDCGECCLPALLPNLAPEAVVRRGTVSACTCVPCVARRMYSMPAVMLPNWSLPPA